MCTKPIAVRTYSDYCNKLVEVGLVQAKRAAIQGKVRKFTVLQYWSEVIGGNFIWANLTKVKDTYISTPVWR